MQKEKPDQPSLSSQLGQLKKWSWRLTLAGYVLLVVFVGVGLFLLFYMLR